MIYSLDLGQVLEAPNRGMTSFTQSTNTEDGQVGEMEGSGINNFTWGQDTSREISTINTSISYNKRRRIVWR